jgi:hypothetical protein
MLETRETVTSMGKGAESLSVPDPLKVPSPSVVDAGRRRVIIGGGSIVTETGICKIGLVGSLELISSVDW